MNKINKKEWGNKLVSVVVRIYNRTRYLPLALQSVTNQSYPFLECVVVDDSTNEESSAKIKRIISRFPEIKISYHKTICNLGYIGTIFEGAKLADGEYILLLDDDDILTPWCIESNLKELSTAPPKTIIVSGKPSFINYANAPIIEKIRKFPVGIFDPLNFLSLLLINNPVQGLSGHFIKKSFITPPLEKHLENKGEKNRALNYSPDTLFLLKLLSFHNSSIKYHNTSTYFYRRHTKGYAFFLSKSFLIFILLLTKREIIFPFLPAAYFFSFLPLPVDEFSGCL